MESRRNQKPFRRSERYASSMPPAAFLYDAFDPWLQLED